MRKPSPALDRLERLIKEAGYITAEELKGLGVSMNNLAARIDVLASSGLIEVVTLERKPSGGREPRAYRWLGDRFSQRENKPTSPNKPAPRSCLGCGKTFASSSAANRICPACSGVNTRAASGTIFDTPATVRYH